MPFFEAVKLALSQIRVQKLKSFFTLLGVMIGVMFLIAVVSIVEGMTRYMTEEFAGRILGVNQFTLRRFPDAQFGDVGEETWRAWLRRPRVTPLEAQQVRTVLPSGTHSAVENINFLNASSVFARPKQVMAVGTEDEYFGIKKYRLTSGRPFTPQEVDRGVPVVVIGVDVAEYFFPSLDPIGRDLRIEGTPYRIIGLLEKQGSLFGFSLDRFAITPYTSPISRSTNPRGDIDGMVVQAPNEAVLGDAMEEARGLMRGLRRLQPGDPDNFVMETSAGALAFFAQLKGKLVAFGTALPAIGLIVGALVIMNIMLVAVAERTREIGIRKALGARRRDIMRQFLVEAATLSVLGAAIGVALGAALAKAIAAVTPLPAAVALWSVIAALVVGAGVGIIAGIYPANRAAKMDPILALRQE
jgi:putative ABC transport system permease protein